ncbi:hypothetical protein AB4305_13345 [Nocardia sp. 2YAB30]
MLAAYVVSLVVHGRDEVRTNKVTAAIREVGVLRRWHGAISPPTRLRR